jgi:hypothetical protein
MIEQLLRAIAVNLVYMLAGVILAIGLFKAADRWLFPGINFIPEVKKGNIAAAILAGVLLIFCGLLVSSGLN